MSCALFPPTPFRPVAGAHSAFPAALLPNSATESKVDRVSLGSDRPFPRASRRAVFRAVLPISRRRKAGRIPPSVFLGDTRAGGGGARFKLATRYWLVRVQLDEKLPLELAAEIRGHENPYGPRGIRRQFSSTTVDAHTQA